MYNKVRTTFGIINPDTHRKYNDIIHAFIIHDTLTVEAIKYEDMFYRHEQKIYILDVDTSLRNRILHEQSVDVIISLQQRMGLNIAVARLPNTCTKKRDNIVSRRLKQIIVGE